MFVIFILWLRAICEQSTICWPERQYFHLKRADANKAQSEMIGWAWLEEIVLPKGGCWLALKLKELLRSGNINPCIWVNCWIHGYILPCLYPNSHSLSPLGGWAPGIVKARQIPITALILRGCDVKVLLFGYGLTRQVYEAGHLISPPMVGG